MGKLPDSSLIIGVATSTAERIQLTRLLSGADALLLVSSAEQARAFLDLTQATASTSVVLTPGVLPAVPAAGQVVGAAAPIEAAQPTFAGSELVNAVRAARTTVGRGSTETAATATTGDLEGAMGLPVGPGAEGSATEPAGEVDAATGGTDVDEAVIELPDGLSLDDARRVVRWKDREMPLTRLEHNFLHCLVAKPGEVWTYQRLHHAVWGNEHLGHGSHIHSVVKRLRQKLADLGAAVTINAVRGVGFHLLPAV